MSAKPLDAVCMLCVRWREGDSQLSLIICTELLGLEEVCWLIRIFGGYSVRDDIIDRDIRFYLMRLCRLIGRV